jgi:hypothetical protein
MCEKNEEKHVSIISLFHCLHKHIAISFTILFYYYHTSTGETEVVGEGTLDLLNSPRCTQEINRINETLESARNFNSSVGGRDRGMEFLGCMPINLSRRNLINVQRYGIIIKRNIVYNYLFLRN